MLVISGIYSVGDFGDIYCWSCRRYILLVISGICTVGYFGGI